MVTPALAEREVMMTEVTESIRKVMVRAPTPVEPTSSMVVHADGARLSDAPKQTQKNHFDQLSDARHIARTD